MSVRKWEGHRLERLLDALGQSQTLEEAGYRFHSWTGEEAPNKNQIQRAFRTNKHLGSPSSWLRGSASMRDAAPPPASMEPEPPTLRSVPHPEPYSEPPSVVVEPSGELVRVLIIPDVHVPYHDKEAWGTMLAAARKLRPGLIIVCGDFADFYSVSFHSKSPKRQCRLEHEVIDVCDALDQLDELGAARKIYVEGNHEYRLTRYLTDKAPELFGLTNVPDLLGLRQRGWQWVPYKSHVKVGGVHFTHDTGNSGKYAIFKAREAFETSVVIGHVHRMGIHYTADARGNARVSACFGWLGDREECDYMHKIRAMREWQHGFGVGYLEPSGFMHMQAIPIVDGRCCLNGEIITRPGRESWRA